MGEWRTWKRPGVVLFDMDGTLTKPVLNFGKIREEMGIAGGRPILEALAEMEGEVRRRAEEVLLRREREAAEAAELNEGCERVLGMLAAAGVRTGLVTRNSAESTRRVLEAHGLAFGAVVTREDEPYKPRPEPIVLAVERLGGKVAREEIWMVGDGEHDIEAGVAAGVRTVWVSHGGERKFGAVPCVEVRDLLEFGGILGRVLGVG